MNEIKPLQQWKEPDCSLLSVMNCVRLNTPELVHVFTQDLAEKLMSDYNRKTPRDAFWYLKNKWYPLKLVPHSYANAKNIMKKGRAVICRRKYNRNYWIDLKDDWEANGSKPIDIDVGKGGHFFCIRQEWEKVYAYDSNFPKKYIIDWEFFHKEWVIGSTFYQVR